MAKKLKNKKDLASPRAIGLPTTLWDKIDKLAEKSGRSRSNYIRQVLIQHVSQTKF